MNCPFCQTVLEHPTLPTQWLRVTGEDGCQYIGKLDDFDLDTPTEEIAKVMLDTIFPKGLYCPRGHIKRH